MNNRSTGLRHGFQDPRVTVTDGGAHLAGGKIQDRATVFREEIRSLRANDQVAQEIAAIVKQMPFKRSRRRRWFLDTRHP
jgi:hypothetical protein